MATYASKLRSEAMDGTTIVLNSTGAIRAQAVMEPVGPIYYVDGNITSSGGGKSWDSAFKTLTEGLAAAQGWHRTSGNWRSWAGRATIFVKGDDLAETITVWARKTDVIGVGSDDSNKGPRILGHHVMDAWVSGTKDFTGLRLYNLTFKPSTTTVLFDIPSGQHGIEFHGCKWEQAAACTTALRLTTCQDTVVDNCQFIRDSNGVGFSTAAISIATGNINHTRITNNYISSAIGIIVHSGTTGQNNIIERNTIFATTLTIDDDSDLFLIVDNRCISKATLGASAYDFADTYACGNIVTGNNNTLDVPIKAA